MIEVVFCVRIWLDCTLVLDDSHYYLSDTFDAPVDCIHKICMSTLI